MVAGNHDYFVHVTDHSLYVTLIVKCQTTFLKHKVLYAENPASFDYIFSLLSNTRLHFPSNFWICCCMLDKLCHLMVSNVVNSYISLLGKSVYLLEDPCKMAVKFNLFSLSYIWAIL